MRLLTAITLHTALLLTHAYAETAEDIVKRIAGDKAKALETYLAANPQATDMAYAKAHLAGAYQESGDTTRQVTALEGLYSALPKGAAGDLRNGVMNLAERMRLYGDKTKSRAALEQTKKDFADHPQIAQAGQAFAQLAAELDLPGVGTTMDIAFTAIDGQKVDLAAMKGKVVLVDFWATWCGPCVAELPTVKQAYTAHHAAGFEVVGISLDQDEAALRAFIKKQELPWPQGFDGKGWGNAMAQKFGVKSIPATFLIGKDGKIAATSLRGEDLGKKVLK
jgi:peroxiredoxin